MTVSETHHTYIHIYTHVLIIIILIIINSSINVAVVVAKKKNLVLQYFIILWMKNKMLLMDTDVLMIFAKLLL